MNASSKITIVAVGPVTPKEFEGRKYEIQEAECLLLKDDGTPIQVAVLRLGEDMRGDKAPKLGSYAASFSLRANPKDRRLGAVLTGLMPLPTAKA